MVKVAGGRCLCCEDDVAVEGVVAIVDEGGEIGLLKKLILSYQSRSPDLLRKFGIRGLS